jgi:hypothetical protein
MKNNIGFFSGFLIMSIQIIGGDIYRNYKIKKSNEKIKSLFKKYNI